MFKKSCQLHVVSNLYENKDYEHIAFLYSICEKKLHYIYGCGENENSHSIRICVFFHFIVKI